MEIFDVIISSLKTMKGHPKFVLPTVLVLVLALALGLAFTFLAIANLSAIHAHAALSVSALLSVLKTMVPSIALLIIIFFFIGILIQGVYISLCSKRNAKNVSLSQAFGAAAGRYRDLLGFGIIAAAISLAAAAAFLLPVAYIGYNSLLLPYLNNVHVSASSAIGFAIVALVMLVLYAVAIATISVLLFAGAPLVMLKGRGPVQALRESYAIGRKDFVNILILLIANAILIGAIELVGSIFQTIPILGAVIYVAISIFVSSYSMLIPPMYYLTFCKK